MQKAQTAHISWLLLYLFGGCHDDLLCEVKLGTWKRFREAKSALYVFLLADVTCFVAALALHLAVLSGP